MRFRIDTVQLAVSSSTRIRFDPVHLRHWTAMHNRGRFFWSPSSGDLGLFVGSDTAAPIFVKFLKTSFQNSGAFKIGFPRYSPRLRVEDNTCEHVFARPIGAFRDNLPFRSVMPGVTRCCVGSPWQCCP
jgi:hypothetical protein